MKMFLGLLFLGLLCRAAPAQGSRFAVRFHGTGTGQVDRVKIPLESATNLNVGADFAVEFWLKADYAENAGWVAEGQNGDGWITGNVVVDRDVYGGGDHGDYGIAIGRSGGRSVLAFGVHNGTWGQTIVGTNQVGDNRWHHVAALRTESNGFMQLLVDGAPDASGTGPTGDVSYRVGRATSFPASDPFLVFGAEKHDAGSEYPSFNGSLDEVRIWSRVPSPAEWADFRARILAAGEQPGLAAYWRFEEGTNMPVRDSARGATGTLYSARPGNGEWTAWQNGANAAPLPAHAPVLAMPRSDPEGFTLSWFVPQNVQYELQSAAAFSPTMRWTTVAFATNLVASDSNVSVAVDGSAGTPYYRVRGMPYR